MSKKKMVLGAVALYLIWREYENQQQPAPVPGSAWATNPGSQIPVWAQQLAQTEDTTSTTSSTAVNPFVNPSGVFC